LHVGKSLTLVIDVVTTQLKLTVPVNPFVPATLMVPVFPVVAPGVTLIEVVPPLPAVNMGCGVMLREMLVDSVSVPEVPVIVTVTGVDVTWTEELACKVSNSVPEEVPWVNVGVTPLGKPVAESVIFPAKPPASVTVIVLVPVPP
jgi:hypothetical protein